MKMNEHFKYKGLWWLPENPEMKIEGELECSNEKMELVLEDNIFKSEKDEKEYIIGKDYPDIPIILGEISKDLEKSEIFVEGIPITLYRCSVDGCTCFPYIIFKNKHFDKEEDIKFKKTLLDFSHIGRFFRSEFPKVSMSNDLIEITYKKLSPIELVINSSCKIVIKKDYKIRSIPGELPISVEENTYVEMDFFEDKNLEEFLRFLQIFNSFLSFLIGNIVHPIEISGCNEENTDNPIEIFYRTPFSFMSRNRLENSYLILSKFENFLKRWFEEREKLGAVYNLYTRIINLLHPFSFIDLLLLTSAIEIYHRQMYGRKHIEDEKYESLLKEVYENLPAELQFLKKENRMKYLNEFSLRKRLREIIEKHQKILTLLIIPKGKTDEFVDWIVKTRNYYVHFDKKVEEIFKEEKLYWLFTALKILLEICILQDLGNYTDEEIKYFVHRRYSYQILKVKEILFE